MKKTIACVLIALMLLVPIPAKMKDGGTVHYNAVLYDVYDVHRIQPTDMPNADGTYDTEYVDGIIVELLGFPVFNSTKPQISI